LHEYGITPVKELKTAHYDAIIMAVAHEKFLSMGPNEIRALGKAEHVLYDIKSVLPKDAVDARL